MRISTAHFHDRAGAGIVSRQADVYAQQAKIASGREVSTGADDPVGASLAVRARGELARSGRWQDAQSAAKTSLSITESTLGAMYDALSSSRTTVLAAGNATLNAADRRTLADQLRGDLAALVGYANVTDADGGYLFAGFDNRTAPFARTDTAVSYNGDSGYRDAEVGPGTTLTVARGGDDLFLRIPSGNGAFETTAEAGNTGSGVVGTGRVTAAVSLTGHAYEVRFTAPGFYDVWDATAGANVSTGNPFSPGGTIAFDGLAFEVSGTPAAGDTFNVDPAGNRSLFDRIQRAITMLESPAMGPAADAWRTGEIAGILQDFDAALDHLSAHRGEAGNALQRVESMGYAVEDRALAQKQQIAAVEDLDYAEASTELASRNLAYEAALAAYAQTGKRSLFDFL